MARYICLLRGTARYTCLLLLGLLFLAASAAVRFPTVLPDEGLQFYSRSKLVNDICECRFLCFVDVSCTAASYDAPSSVCSMAHDAPQDVTLQQQPGVITMFTFRRSSCKPTTPEAVIFITKSQTNNGSWQEQTKLCGDEGGVPLVIKTLEERAAATTATAGTLSSDVLNKYAWITATRTKGATGAGPLQWLDGSNVTDCVYSTDDFINFETTYLACMVRDNDKLESSPFQTKLAYSVLCTIRPGF